MCGICGIWGGTDSENVMKSMTPLLKHRGPDDIGVYVDSKVCLGHTRLSIIDLSSNGKQPMRNEDGTVWLCINGEIYNFKDLRDELSKKGHIFSSLSDSETVVHAYEEYDLDFVRYLRGMFALAIYDKSKERLILARDRIGKKPLYYYFKDGKFVFASEIKAILKAGVAKEVDEKGLYCYIAYQHCLGNATLFKNIKKVLPANMLVLEAGQVKIRDYWDIKENISQTDEESATSALRELLQESTRLRMVADVPVGAFLSGGIDSSAIVALSRQYGGKEFHTFSVGFETFTELPFAKQVSEYLHTTHHEIIVTDEQVNKDLTEIAWYNDEPVGDAATINNYYLSKEARKYVKVVLAGEGGDELFGGYPEYKRMLSVAPAFHLPTLIRKGANRLIELIPWPGVERSYWMYRSGELMSQPTLEKAHLQTRRTLGIKEQIQLCKKDISFVDDMINKPGKMGKSLNRLLALDCKNLLPEKFLMKADKGTMANAVEERLPLLDQKVIEFAFSLPPNMKIHKGIEKYIFRKAVEDMLPENIVWRAKQGFGTPVENWLKGALKERVKDSISNSSLLKTYLDQQCVRDLTSSQYGANITWTLFALDLWYQTFFDNWETNSSGFTN
ncbi:MAG: asparagine synthase (glutamine-hydrolyzing) [Paludibacter sp.]|nr:asparagine synthase (glutamine-hydrolyzing) [Paludibacter sp.]